MKHTLLAIAVVSALGTTCNVNADTTTPSSIDIDALRDAIAKQQALLDAQQKQLDALQAAKLASQDAPRWSMNYGRPTLTSADGRSSLSLRALVQADYAHYAQDATGPLASDYRRGSVGSTANR